MLRHRWLAVLLGWTLTAPAHAQTPLEADEQTLRSHAMPLDAKGLVRFFQGWSLKEGDEKHLEEMVRNLGSNVFPVREKADKELLMRGPAVLPFLKKALADAPLETKRRAELCISKIQATMQSDAIGAAARVLALRDEASAASVLLHFLPSVSSDPFLEDDLLATLGRITVRPGKVDPLILKALNDPLAYRRSAAAYVLGRRGGVEHRAALRQLLGDPDALVRQRVAEGLFGKRPPQLLQEAVAGDEALVRAQKIDPSAAGLLEFFRKRTLSEGEQQRFRAMVKDLGGAYAVREQATRKLIKEGPPVLAFLKEAESDRSAERARRVQYCLDEIRGSNNTFLPVAAAHLLARLDKENVTSPAEAIRTLLAYVPFVDDEAVEEEVLTCLTVLSLREPSIEPSLIAALADPSPSLRAASAYALGHVAAADSVAKLTPLLKDANPVVRLRAAQGLLAARDKSSLASFVSLLEAVPAVYLPKLEETLYRVAEDKGPSDAIIATTDARQKAAKAWGKWLADNQARVDLTSMNERDAYLGLVTIAEYDNRNNNFNGQAWETSRGGAKRWGFEGLRGVMDAHALPNGRVLVAENNANSVSERDVKGNIKWQYQTQSPICCQRLPNGNTFIASYNMVTEVTPNKTEVYRYTPGPQFYIFSAHKARNGNIVAITAQGQIIELDSKTGKTLHTMQTNTLGNWCSVELLNNGNYLVASMSTNSVREIDRKNGQEVWSKQFMGAFRATRMPNGNVLVASMTTKQVAEIDRTGAIRWSTTCEGRPWSVHYR